MATRFAGAGGPYEGLAAGGNWAGKVQVVEDALDDPRHWRKPRRIFVCSMSDLYHDHVSNSTIDRVMRVIRDCPQHQFILLTKRSKRLRSLRIDYPRNAWVGVSVEDAQVVGRIDDLRQINAAVKWVSFEPLIGPVEPDLTGIDWAAIGGESGPRCRPMGEGWVWTIHDECRRRGAAFLFKQWGGLCPKKNGRRLGGRLFDEYPVQENHHE